MSYGDEIHGEIHSTDASAGVAIPIYKEGNSVAHTLQANEVIVITSISLVSAVGGDCYVWFDNDGGGGVDIDAGETIARGTFAANGGINHDFGGQPRVGQAGIAARLQAPAGVVDVVFTGYIRTR